MPRILIVDDMSSIRALVRAVLRTSGFEQVDDAGDGQAALLKLGSTRYDLLISDWNMPILDGLGLLRAVRSHAALQALPVIMLTAETTKEHVAEAAKLGVSGFVAKPFKPDTLLSAVSRVFPAPKRP